MENMMAVPQKLSIELLYDSEISLGIYPKSLKSESGRDSYTPVFIAALLTIARRWKQPKCVTRMK